jgi:uncharacterized protein with PIN domain
VIDAGPLVAILLDEASAPRVRARLEELRRSSELAISSVNWCEVLYSARLKAGPFVEALAVSGFRALPIAVVDCDERLASHAADMKARFGLGLGDCFAAGLAMALGAPLLTGDADFLPLGQHGLQIDWVGEERL